MAPRVMIVDDSKFMRLAVGKLLTEKGEFEVVGEADSDTGALEKYKELKPDLVTMDIIMPYSGGLRALALIREFDPSARVVMVTAMGQDSVTQEALDLGAKGFVHKPVKQEDLIAALKKALE